MCYFSQYCTEAINEDKYGYTVSETTGQSHKTQENNHTSKGTAFIAVLCTLIYWLFYVTVLCMFYFWFVFHT